MSKACLDVFGCYDNHLLKTANTEVESNLLKSIRKVESTLYGKVANSDCCLGQLGSIGASDLIPCKTLLKISVKSPSSLFLCDASHTA